MNDNEPLAVLREIRDILNEQTELVKSQYARYAKIAKWNQIVSLIVWFPIMIAVAAILVGK
jgi:hypothetical protein